MQCLSTKRKINNYFGNQELLVVKPDRLSSVKTFEFILPYRPGSKNDVPS